MTKSNQTETARRRVLQAIPAAGAAGAVWSKPALQSVVLPAHAKSTMDGTTTTAAPGPGGGGGMDGMTTTTMDPNLCSGLSSSYAIDTNNALELRLGAADDACTGQRIFSANVGVNTLPTAILTLQRQSDGTVDMKGFTTTGPIYEFASTSPIKADSTGEELGNVEHTVLLQTVATTPAQRTFTLKFTLAGAPGATITVSGISLVETTA